MSTTQAAKRRRRHHAINFMHLGPLVRPHYKKPDAATSRRRLQEQIALERRMAANKGKNKK